ALPSKIVRRDQVNHRFGAGLPVPLGPQRADLLLGKARQVARGNHWGRRRHLDEYDLPYPLNVGPFLLVVFEHLPVLISGPEDLSDAGESVPFANARI